MVQHQTQRKWEGTTTIPLEEMRAFLTAVHDESFMAKASVVVEVVAEAGQYRKRRAGMADGALVERQGRR